MRACMQQRGKGYIEGAGADSAAAAISDLLGLTDPYNTLRGRSFPIALYIVGQPKVNIFTDYTDPSVHSPCKWK